MPDFGSPDGRDVDERQPEWVCLDCAEKYAGDSNSFPTWLMGTCDVCERKKPVTPPTVFGFLSRGWEKAVDRFR